MTQTQPRDWRAEIVTAMGPVHQFTVGDQLPWVLADRVVRALGLDTQPDPAPLALAQSQAQDTIDALTAELDDLRAVPPAELQSRIEKDLRREAEQARAENARLRTALGELRERYAHLRRGTTELADAMPAWGRSLASRLDVAETAGRHLRALLAADRDQAGPETAPGATQEEA